MKKKKKIAWWSRNYGRKNCVGDLACAQRISKCVTRNVKILFFDGIVHKEDFIDWVT